MKDRFTHTSNLPRPRAFEYDKETQLLNNMESVHLRKKAAFDELLRYTYNNLKDTNNENRDNQDI